MLALDWLYMLALDWLDKGGASFAVGGVDALKKDDWPP